MCAPDKEAEEDGDDGLDDGDHHRELHLGRPLTHDPRVPLPQIPDDHWFSLGEVHGTRGLCIFHGSEDTKTVENRPLLTSSIDSPDIPRHR